MKKIKLIIKRCIFYFSIFLGLILSCLGFIFFSKRKQESQRDLKKDIKDAIKDDKKNYNDIDSDFNSNPFNKSRIK